jgi:ABC-type amino acid transport substrate-binding protein
VVLPDYVNRYFCFSLSLLQVQRNYFAAEKLLLLTDARPPFHFLTKSGEVDGVSVVVVKRALDKMNWPYEIKISSWNRAQSAVKKGYADGFFQPRKILIVTTMRLSQE